MTVKIGIIGAMRSGKDTFAEPLIYSEGLYPMKFADGIHEIIENYFPETLLEGSKPREHYQHIGQSLRQLNPDVWVNRLEQDYRTALFCNDIEPLSGYIITDVRQPNEVEWCKRNGFTIVKLVASSDVRRQRILDCGDKFEEKQFYHETESYVKQVAADYVINSNCSKEELQKKAVELYQKLSKQEAE